MYKPKHFFMKNRLFVVCLLMGLSAGLFSCSKDDSENEAMTSSSGSNESHNAGRNCMECHRSGGSGEGIFNLAGTVYNEALTSINPNATVNLYTGANGTGTLIKAIEVDAKGNLYTTSSIDFGSGLYVSVDGATTIKYMSSAITNGACNSCHGSSTSKIWTK